MLAHAWDRALGGAVARGWWRAPDLLCLNYHRVAAAVACDDGVVSATPAELDWQVSWLRQHVRVVGGDEVVDLARGAATLAEPAVCLTFDDGYADNFAAGVDLATRHGVRAIFFVTTGFVETGVIPWWDRLSYATKHAPRARLRVAAVGGSGPWTMDLTDRKAAADVAKGLYRRLAPSRQPAFVDAVEEAAGVSAADAGLAADLFMSWDQIRELHRLGHTIGAHTHSHRKLTTLDAREQRRELEGSKRELEERLGAPVVLLAYPYGTRDAFDEQTQHVAAACGFAGAFSFCGGRNRVPFDRRYDLRRMPVGRDVSRGVFTARLTSRFPF